LLTLYTKEIDLRKILQTEKNALTALLYLHLNRLIKRAYGPSETFHGMIFTNSTQYRTVIDHHRWAKQRFYSIRYLTSC
jgi:hypothetical protein